MTQTISYRPYNDVKSSHMDDASQVAEMQSPRIAYDPQDVPFSWLKTFHI